MKKLNFIFLIDCKDKLYSDNNITLYSNCLGELIIFVSLKDIILSLKPDILEKLLNILIYFLNKISIFYRIILLLIDKIIIIYIIIKFIYNFISSTLVLKFNVSNKDEYPKRDRSPEEEENTESSAWKERLDKIEEREMDIKDLRKDLKEAENAVRIENNPNFPPQVKSNNRHLRSIEENYPEFFDSHDDANNTNRGLSRVINHLKKEEQSLIQQLEDLKRTPNEALDDLPAEMPGISEDGE